MGKHPKMNKKAISTKNVVEETKKVSLQKEADRIRLQDHYFQNKFNAEFERARCDIIVQQLNSGKYTQVIDGVPKTKELLLSEYKSYKMLGVKAAREAYFLKEKLVKEHKYTEEKLNKIEEEYLTLPVFREVFAEEDRRVGARRING